MMSRLIKHKMVLGRKAYTIIELTIAGFFLLLVLFSAFGIYILANQYYINSKSEADLFWEADYIMKRLLAGEHETTEVFRLPEAVSYSIDTAGSPTKFHFVGTDGTDRYYYVNAATNSIICNHPTASGTRDETIYTAPVGTQLSLNFRDPGASNPTWRSMDVYIDLALSRLIGTKQVTAALTTMVNIRNHP